MESQLNSAILLIVHQKLLCDINSLQFPDGLGGKKRGEETLGESHSQAASTRISYHRQCLGVSRSIRTLSEESVKGTCDSGICLLLQMVPCQRTIRSFGCDFGASGPWARSDEPGRRWSSLHPGACSIPGAGQLRVDEPTTARAHREPPRQVLPPPFFYLLSRVQF